jgi:hypothetical protein
MDLCLKAAIGDLGRQHPCPTACGVHCRVGYPSGRGEPSTGRPVPHIILQQQLRDDSLPIILFEL